MIDDYKERLERTDPLCLIHEYGVPGAVRFAVARCKELEQQLHELKHQHSLEVIRLRGAKQRNVNTTELSRRISTVLMDFLIRARESEEIIEGRPHAILDTATHVLTRLQLMIIPYEPMEEKSG